LSDVDPSMGLWGLLRGALGTRALGFAADLGVADALADGPRRVAELAKDVGADEDTLQRVLRALASEGVFAEEEEGVVRNTEASDLLRSDNADRWDAFAHLFGGPFYSAVGHLDVRTTDVAFTRGFGTDFWSWLASNPAERANFDRAMEARRSELADRLAVLEWREGETVVDIGGGSGTLLRELIDRLPGLRGIILDLPETDRDERELGENIAFLAGSFFERAPEGDVYVLSKILHDWDDERAALILRTIRVAAPDHARLLVLDSIVPPGNEQHGAKWLDLLMLALLGGRERTETEWRSLLESARFGIDKAEDGLIQATCR
jgi:O-methyltransferase domain